MQLLLVINLDKAQVKSTVLWSLKFSRVRTFKSWDFEDLLYIPIYFVEIFLAEEPKKKIIFPSN
jgi:hypothetical protein